MKNKDYPDILHPSHGELGTTDSSYSDVYCKDCGARDSTPGGWGNLKFPCSMDKNNIKDLWEEIINV